MDLLRGQGKSPFAFFIELLVPFRYPPTCGAALLDGVLPLWGTVRPGLLARFQLGVFLPVVVWLISLLSGVKRSVFFICSL